MLDLTCRRARLEDGQDVLELGCGWGSLTLYMAGRFPNSRILAVSNSRSQKEFIEAEAARRGLANLEVVTADMNDFDTERRFDRIVSVEMFEHMRNYGELLRRISSCSRPEALLFVHVFSHSRFAYPFEVRDASDWMAQHFFTGGQYAERRSCCCTSRSASLSASAGVSAASITGRRLRRGLRVSTATAERSSRRVRQNVRQTGSAPLAGAVARLLHGLRRVAWVRSGRNGSYRTISSRMRPASRSARLQQVHRLLEML